ncbi:MAG TPA: 5-oxoprolinase/urea amidolyase family protein, partial [Thermomicrobiales bacterium]|nr:5-oxoprolinase/urea amidolyase family protein [Thermomicrobiales bacterium]
PGLLDSVQDLGRPGRMRAGVTPGGACDRAALTLGNRLVGNPPDAAGIEATLAGPTLRFHGDAIVALTGADAAARLNGEAAPGWEPFAVRDGEELALGALRNGARTYVCVAGGIDVPLVLGGRGTDVFGRFGGWQGRALAAGDRLPLGPPAAPVAELLRRRLVASPPARDPAMPIRLVLGPQRDRFTDDAVATLLDATYAVTPQSDRVGLRLRGPALAHRDGADLISEGIAAGAIQAPGDGQPIVLLPARQTIGGYPKIATVIGADLDRLGQARPGDALRFAAVEVEEARLALLAARAALGPEAVTERARPVPGWSPDAASEPTPTTAPAAARAAWTPAAVADLIERARRADAASLDLEIAAAGLRLQVRWRGALPNEAAPPCNQGAVAEPTLDEDEIIAAPVLGIFYRRSEPGAPPLAEVGQLVRAGQIIAVLEVMKTYHEVAAPHDGAVTAFLVDDGAFVEYGQPLARMTTEGTAGRG